MITGNETAPTITPEERLELVRAALGQMDFHRTRKWVEALESGKYKQGEGLLVQWTDSYASDSEVTAYCCLGVYCSVVRGMTDTQMRHESTEGIIPSDIEEFERFASQQVFFASNDGGEFMTTSYGLRFFPKLTFPEIAALIREAFPATFAIEITSNG